MKLVFEKVRGSGVSVGSVMIEREDMPWDNKQQCDEDRSFKTAVKVALAYHQLTSLKPNMISRDELMNYLGYGSQSTKTATYKKLPDTLREIGCVCNGFDEARPKMRLGYQLDFDILKLDKPFSETEKKKFFKQYSPYISLSFYQILELIKAGSASAGGKFNEFLRLYLLVRHDMKSCYSNNPRLFLGMYAMLSQSRIHNTAGLSEKTIVSMTNTLEQAGLIFKLSGRKASEDVYSINCYATTNDPRLADAVRKVQIEKGIKKKQLVAARKGHGSSILDRSIRDAVGVTDFQV